MAKATKRARARELVLNVLALKVADQVQAMAQAAGRAHLANLEPRESEALALEAVELAASWARAYLVESAAAAAAAPPVRLGELAATPVAAQARGQ